MSRLAVIALGIALLAVPTVSSSTLAAGPTCDGLAATLVGTADSDLIRGTPGRDVIVGRGGHDTILGRGGRDVVCAGGGQDTVRGGDGRDRIFGQAGDDRLRGGAGFDAIDGGAGTDACDPGANGGTMVACEPADLAVQVIAPTSVEVGQSFAVTVKVVNVGALRSAPYTRVVTETLTNVSCDAGLSVSAPRLPLRAGAYREDVWVHALCDILPGGDPHLVFEASIEQAGPDADPTNDNASARVDVIPQPET